MCIARVRGHATCDLVHVSNMTCIIHVHASVFCPHWSGVVGPTTTQPIFTTTQGKFSREKSAVMLHFS